LNARNWDKGGEAIDQDEFESRFDVIETSLPKVLDF
jgi:hypothetical protein